MIKETLKAHGKRRLEIKQRVSFPGKEEHVRYRVETWFFMPLVLQINRWTYTPQEFQRSLKNYIRMRPPSADLNALAGKDGALERLEHELKDTAQADNASASLAVYEDRLKRFGLTYKRALRLAIERLSDLPVDFPCDEQINRFSAALETCLQRYRSLLPQARQIENRFSSPAFFYCDEYLSIVTTHYGRDLLQILPECEARERLRELWRQEMRYRQEHYPDSVPSKDSDNELPVYRWSVLKKYISSYLFFDVRRKPGLPLLLHSLYGIAAALSMVFATVVAFMWQGRYGALSMNLFLALIIAYIFKDRMKDISREKLFTMFRRWIPDRRQVIYANPQTPIGTCVESFRFVDESILPESIRQLRSKSHFVDIDNAHRSEDILFYSKDVHIKNMEAVFSRARRSILDISRFDISDFLKHTDELYEEMPILDDEEMVVGEKVYHINMIRRVTRGDTVSLERARLIIHSEGIKRIEMVQPLTEAPPESNTFPWRERLRKYWRRNKAPLDLKR